MIQHSLKQFSSNMGNAMKKQKKKKAGPEETAIRKPSYVLTEDILKAARELSEEKLAELREAFKLFDKDNDHFIDVSELRTVLESTGHSPTDEDLELMVAMCDIDQSGTIDFEEFVIMMLWYAKNSNPEEELRQALKVFDKDGDGLISCAEFKEIMMTRGERLTEAEAEEMIRDADCEATGMIDCNRFIKILCLEIDKTVEHPQNNIESG